ncbi:MAG: chorismate synthase, partial [Pseudomonadota bacterium]
EWESVLDEARKDGNSLGALIECRASGVPAGLGAPVYGKMDSDLAAAMMTINAAKGVEIGAGFSSAYLSGTENADEMHMEDGHPVFDPSGPDNTNGGVLGGITTGQDLVVRLAIKPTSSILTPRKTVTRQGEETEVVTKGRHDPCVGIRGVPVARAMMALVLADHALRHRGQVGQLGAHED